MKQVNKNVKIIPTTQVNDFVGVTIEEKAIYVHVPESFRYNNDNVKESMPDIIQLLKSISMSKKKQKKNIKRNDNFEVGEFWSIDSYLWLINDYIDKGLYYPREKIFSSNHNGKIEWKKTLKNNPIVSNGNIVYNDIITSKAMPMNATITQIYEVCLYIAVLRIGWVFNYKFKIAYERKMTVKEMLYIIKCELSSTFDDTKRLRFKHMISILENVNERSIASKTQSYGVNHYYRIFEKMVDQLFGNVTRAQKKKYNPPTYWVMPDKSKYQNSPLEPDTILNFCNGEVKTTYIIDSKMYGYGCTSNMTDLPGSQSIQKQITYGDYVKNTLEKNNNVMVRNVFILPFNKEKNEFNKNNNLLYFGYSIAAWRDKTFFQDHDYIFGYFIDFNYLLNNFKRNDELTIYLYNEVERKLSWLNSIQN